MGGIEESGTGDFTIFTFGPETKYPFMFCTPLTRIFPSSAIENSRRSWSAWFEIPTITTVTPALLLARLDHLNEVWAKAISWPVLKMSGHEIAFAHTSFKWSNLASNKAGVTEGNL